MISIIAKLLVGHLGFLQGYKSLIGAALTVVAFGVDAAGLTGSPIWTTVLQISQALGIGIMGVGLGHRAGTEGQGVKSKKK